VNVNANSRYDAGFYFRTDGGTNARGPVGTCSLTTLALPPGAGTVGFPDVLFPTEKASPAAEGALR